MARFYNCNGKGGLYVLVGVSTGAGQSRGEQRAIYRDADTGELYHRTPDDFNARMTLCGDTSSYGPSGEMTVPRWLARSLLDVLEEMQSYGQPLPALAAGLAEELRERISLVNGRPAFPGRAEQLGGAANMPCATAAVLGELLEMLRAESIKLPAVAAGVCAELSERLCLATPGAGLPEAEPQLPDMVELETLLAEHERRRNRDSH